MPPGTLVHTKARWTRGTRAGSGAPPVSGLRDGAGDADEREARNLGAMAMAGAMEPVVWRHPRGFLRQVALGCFQHLGTALNVRLQSGSMSTGVSHARPSQPWRERNRVYRPRSDHDRRRSVLPRGVVVPRLAYPVSPAPRRALPSGRARRHAFSRGTTTGPVRGLGS